MKPWLPRQPARSGLTCDLLAESPVMEDCAAQIQRTVGENGRVVRMGGSSPDVAGFYRFDRAGSGTSYFLKIVAIDQVERQQRADRVARHVAVDGIGTSILLPGYPRVFDQRHALLAYDFIEGRPPTANPEDLYLLGVSLGRLHTSLATVPWAAEVRREAALRRSLLAQRQHSLIAKEAEAGPDPARLRTELANCPDAFTSEGCNCQVIHGDLNPGNILMENDGRVVFLDFEDSLVAWLPVRVDLALLMERTILVTTEDEAEALALGRAFASGYMATTDRKPFAANGSLARTLRWLALRSFCLLAEFEAQGLHWPDDEWHKFIYLLDMAERRRSTISAIEDSFVARNPAGTTANT